MPVSFTIDSQMMVTVVVTMLGGIGSIMVVGIRWAVKQQLDSIEDLRKEVKQIRCEYAEKAKMDTLAQDLRFVQQDYVTKAELSMLVNQLDKSITTSGNNVRDALARVHERIDKIFEKMYSNGLGK